MTPFLTPDQQEHLKMAQRSQVRLQQSFGLFAALVASGDPPQEAIRTAEKAMDIWQEYEDAHLIEVPVESTPTGALLQQFSGAMQMLQKRDEAKTAAEQELAEDDEWYQALIGAEVKAWSARLAVLNLIADLRRNPVGAHAFEALDREAQAADAKWRAFGTAHLRIPEETASGA